MKYKLKLHLNKKVIIMKNIIITFFMKILIIEDHPKLRENIAKYLKANSYLSESAFNWQEALEKIGFSKYDLLILDINMPIMDGREFMKKFREKNKKTPVIALTSNSMLDDKIEIFELWVDDYLTKPFELKELELRIKALLSRKETTIDDILNIWDITINYSWKKVYKTPLNLPLSEGKELQEIKFSNKEYLIIEFLSKNKWYPKTKIQLLEHVWWEQEENLELSSTTLEAHISTIRKKLGSDFIKTIRWVGYIIE